MASPLSSADAVPLCVDLDGTLVKTDIFAESLIQLIKRNPFYFFVAIAWFFKGKAHLKAEVAKRVRVQPELLPYNQDVIGYIAQQARMCLLVTGSNVQFAEPVARHLGLFDEVIASDAEVNLTRRNKRKRLVERFGERGFDYIGNDRDDWDVWGAARQVLVVAKGRFLERTRKTFSVDKVFELPRPGIRGLTKAIRVHQWLKNLLIFIPFVLDHRFGDYQAIVTLTLGFFALSLLASFTYVLNDLFDLSADRTNETKRLRAFASGLIPIKQALLIMAVLLVAVLALATQLNLAFQLILGIYFVSTVLYSMFFKSLAILDVCVLASLYTLRVIGGGVAIGAEWSFWLLAFSMFFFISLALAKRVSELTNIKTGDSEWIRGRGYQVGDLPVLINAGVSSGLLSILVVALYINADKVLQMYAFPQLLWLICPLLLYWIGRVWIITTRGLMHEDPILFAIRDRVSLLTVLCGALVVVSAVFLPVSF